MSFPLAPHDHDPTPPLEEGEGIPTEHFARIAFDKAQGRSSTTFWFRLSIEKQLALQAAGYSIEMQYEPAKVVFGENDTRKYVVTWPDAAT